MVVVGLTGGIGAGKSTVAGLLRERGASIIDVDAVGRAVLLRDGGGAYEAVVSHFGSGVVGGDGEIDRGALGRLVFGDPASLAELTAISHPSINIALRELVGQVSTSMVVLDMAVLVESELGKGLYGVVVVVEASWPVRLSRLLERGLSEADAVARRDAQADDTARRAVADYVIVNDGDLGALDAVVEPVWADLIRRGERARP
jgi:dephospho-CoA kinase